jgi:hypothetical protein
VPDPSLRPREKQFPALDNENAKRMVENLEGLLAQSIEEGKKL